MHINIIWGLWNTLYEFDNQMGAILDGYSLNNHTLLLFAPREVPRILGTILHLPIPKAWPTSLAVKQWELIHLHIHSIWRLWKTYMCLTMKWEPSWIGQQPQYSHYTAVSQLGGIPIIPGIFKSKRLFWQDWQWYDKDSSICTSTLYEGCETPFICLALMWEPFWTGL